MDLFLLVHNRGEFLLVFNTVMEFGSYKMEGIA